MSRKLDAILVMKEKLIKMHQRLDSMITIEDQTQETIPIISQAKNYFDPKPHKPQRAQKETKFQISKYEGKIIKHTNNRENELQNRRYFSPKHEKNASSFFLGNELFPQTTKHKNNSSPINLFKMQQNGYNSQQSRKDTPRFEKLKKKERGALSSILQRKQNLPLKSVCIPKSSQRVDEPVHHSTILGNKINYFSPHSRTSSQSSSKKCNGRHYNVYFKQTYE